MRAARLAGAVLVALFLGVTGAGSQEPPVGEVQPPEAEQPAESGGLGQEDSEAEANSADQFPPTLPLFEAEDSQGDTAAEADENSDEQAGERDGFWSGFKVTDVLIAAFTGFLAISSFLLWWTTWGVADEAKKSNELTRDIFVSGQRAWVTLSVINVAFALKGGVLHACVYIRCTNIGKTPARSVTVVSRIIDGRKESNMVEAVERLFDQERERAPNHAVGVTLLPSESEEQNHLTHTPINERGYNNLDIRGVQIAVCVTYRLAPQEAVAQIGRAYMVSPVAVADSKFELPDNLNWGVITEPVGNGWYSRVT